MLFTCGTADPVVDFSLTQRSGEMVSEVLGEAATVRHVQRGMHQVRVRVRVRVRVSPNPNPNSNPDLNPSPNPSPNPCTSPIRPRCKLSTDSSRRASASRARR